MNRSNNLGFTFVEIVVILAIVALTAAIAVVNLLASRRTVEYNLCINNRVVLEHAEMSYYAIKKVHSKSFKDLVTSGYLAKVPVCPSKGVYAWVPYASNNSAYKSQVGCSLHGKK